MTIEADEMAKLLTMPPQEAVASVMRDRGFTEAAGRWIGVGRYSIAHEHLMGLIRSHGLVGFAKLIGDLDYEKVATERHIAHIATVLAPWANAMAARFGWPVWLVGSILEKEYPRDIDVRVILPDDEFDARYGTWLDIRDVNVVVWSEKARAWAEDCGKQNRWVARNCRLNVDFQIQALTEQETKHKERPRRRLDQITSFVPEATPWKPLEGPNAPPEVGVVPCAECADPIKYSGGRIYRVVTGGRTYLFCDEECRDDFTKRGGPKA